MTDRPVTDRHGWMEGGAHVYPVTVFYDDTDAGGIVYHTRYLVMAERARTAILHVHGFRNRDLAARHNIAIAVRHIETDFLKAARLEDELTVRSHPLEIRGASFRMHQRIFRENDLLVDLRLRLACIGLADGRAARLPGGIAALWKTMIVADES